MADNNCETLSRAKTLALEQGLVQQEVFCIFAQICNGLTCAMSTPLTAQEKGMLAKKQMNVFYQRLERTIQLRSNGHHH